MLHACGGSARGHPPRGAARTGAAARAALPRRRTPLRGQAQDGGRQQQQRVHVKAWQENPQRWLRRRPRTFFSILLVAARTNVGTPHARLPRSLRGSTAPAARRCSPRCSPRCSHPTRWRRLLLRAQGRLRLQVRVRVRRFRGRPQAQQRERQRGVARRGDSRVAEQPRPHPQPHPHPQPRGMAAALLLSCPLPPSWAPPSLALAHWEQPRTYRVASRQA